MCQASATNENQPLYIQKVIIENFKSLRHVSIDFTPGINILVGNNESGKTTVLEAICLAVSGTFRGEVINRCLSEYLFNRDVVDQYLKSVNDGGAGATTEHHDRGVSVWRRFTRSCPLRRLQQFDS